MSFTIFLCSKLLRAITSFLIISLLMGPVLMLSSLTATSLLYLVVHKIYYPEAPLAEFLFEFELTVPDLVVKVLAKRVV